MNDQNNEQTALLKEIAKWVRFSGFKQVKEVLETTFEKDNKKILAYHLSDGKTTSTIISQKTGINQPRVTELWKEWLALGLGESVTASGGSRFKRSFDLKMFGIQVPEVTKQSKTTENQITEQPKTEEPTHE